MLTVDSPHIAESVSPRTNALVIVPQEKRKAKISKGITKMEEVRIPVSSSKSKEETEKNDMFDGNIGDSSLFKNPPYYRIEEERNKPKELVSSGVREVETDGGEENKRKGKNCKESTLSRSDSKRAFRRIPSSPSLILEGMKKRVDCIGKKPLVLDDNDCEYYASARNSYIKSSIKTIKKAVKF